MLSTLKLMVHGSHQNYTYVTLDVSTIGLYLGEAYSTWTYLGIGIKFNCSRLSSHISCSVKEWVQANFPSLVPALSELAMKWVLFVSIRQYLSS